MRTDITPKAGLYDFDGSCTCHECEYVGADKIGEFCVICVRDVRGRVACSTFSSPELDGVVHNAVPEVKL